jgi:hypothetical protein
MFTVKLKNSGNGDIFIHDTMRVDYAVSGGCTISKSSKAVSSGSLNDNYVIDAYVGSCVFSFTAFFGASPETIRSTYSQPNSIVWTVIAKSIVFTESLAVSPLTGSLEYPFQGVFFLHLHIIVVFIILFLSAVALRNDQNELITNHVALIVTPSIISGSCSINSVAKIIESGGVFDYSTTSGSNGKIIFTNYIGSCVLRLMATFKDTAGSVTAGESCTASSPSAPDQTRAIKASSVNFVAALPSSFVGGHLITYSRMMSQFSAFSEETTQTVQRRLLFCFSI